MSIFNKELWVNALSRVSDNLDCDIIMSIFNKELRVNALSRVSDKLCCDICALLARIRRFLLTLNTVDILCSPF